MRQAAHAQWWADWHARSFVRCGGDGRAEVVHRGYNLQRFLSACAARGRYPIKFNGSLFTVDAVFEENGTQTVFDADYRRWGGHYWHQNTRLAYWPMLAAGEFDFMGAFFDLYSSQLELARLRSRLFGFGDGAVFPETMTIFGTYAGDNYDWEREGRKHGEMRNENIRLHICGALETCSVMVDYAEYTEDTEFIRSQLLPFADAVLRHYFARYPRTADGFLRMEPSQSLETWQETVNPTPDVASLRFVLEGLLRLPEDLLPQDQRVCCTQWLAAIPPLPISTLAQRRALLCHQIERFKAEPGKHDFSTVPIGTSPESPVLLPAAQVRGRVTNWENPELYAVFPYRHFQVGKPDVNTGRTSYLHRHEIVPLPAWFRGRFRTIFAGWNQDDVHAALLGLTEEAVRGVFARFSTSDPRSRFPAFWGPNFDWTPDQDHGTVGLLAVHAMLLQPVGSALHLLPAWPREWDVHFKLHAPKNTTVELCYVQGKITRCEVIPASRMADIVWPAWLSPAANSFSSESGPCPGP